MTIEILAASTIVVGLLTSAENYFSVGSTLVSSPVVKRQLLGKDVHVGDTHKIDLYGGRLNILVKALCRVGIGARVDVSTSVVVLPSAPASLPVDPKVMTLWEPMASLQRLVKGAAKMQGGVVVGVFGSPGSGKTTAICRGCEAEGFFVIRVPAVELLRRCPNDDVMDAVTAYRDLAVSLRLQGIAVALLLDDVDRLDHTRGTRFSLALALRRASEDHGLTIFVTAEREDALPLVVRRVLEHTIQVAPPCTDDGRESMLLTAIATGGDDLRSDSSHISQLVQECGGLIPREIKAALWSSKDTGLELDRYRQASRRRSAVHFASIPTQSNIVQTEALGLEEAMEAVKEAVFWPRDRADELAALGVEAPRGILLYGPAGTGKTTVARNVSRWAGSGIVSIDAASIVRGEVGGSEENLESSFALARATAPCVLFIDELDALFELRRRKSSTSTRLVSALVLELARGDVPVLAATNRPWDIDSTLLRIGRFERCVHVPLPTSATRVAMAEEFSKRLRLQPDASKCFWAWAKSAEGFSGADIGGLARNAFLQTLSRRTTDASRVEEVPEVTLEDLKVVLDAAKPSVNSIEADRLAQWRP